MLPAVRAGEVDDLAGCERGGEPRARLVVDQLPAGIGDRRVRAEKVVHLAAPRMPPMPSDPRRSRLGAEPPSSPEAASAASPCSTMSPGLEEHALGDLAPARRPPQQELEIHAEVLELLTLGVAHDRGGLGIGLDREALLVPADRLGLFGQRGAEAREGPGLGGQLVGRFVVLVESHRFPLRVGRVVGSRRSIPCARFAVRKNARMADAGNRRDLHALREQALSFGSVEIKAAPVVPGGQALGVVMDMGYDTAVVSVVGLADGTTSMYISNGGGMIGVGENPDAAAASKRWVEVAEAALPGARRERRRPAARRTERSASTSSRPGRRFSGEAPESELAEGTHPLSALYAAGQDVITQIRIVDEARKAVMLEPSTIS